MNRPILPIPRESVIQRGILEWLAYSGVFAWRANQQGVPIHEPGRATRFRPSPTRGVSDILGVLPGGRFLAVEVKRPGNKPTPAQQDFLNNVNKKGGLGIVATCIGDVELALRAYLPQNPETTSYCPAA